MATGWTLDTIHALPCDEFLFMLHHSREHLGIRSRPAAPPPPSTLEVDVDLD